MNESYGDLVLSYTLNDVTNKIYLGYVTSMSELFTKGVSSFPLISMSQDDCFAIENNSSLTYHIGFKHVDGATINGMDGAIVTPDSDNPSSESSADWYDRLTSFVDRWQARTNGFRLDFIPYDSEYPGSTSGLRPGQQDPTKYNPVMYPLTNVSGFIRSLSRTYNAGDPTVIECDMRFEVGTMYIRRNALIPMGYTESSILPLFSAKSVKKSDFQILISNAKGSVWYPLLHKAEELDSRSSCLTSYKLLGGPESPFETLELTLSAKKLTAQFPMLINNISLGESRIILNAVGRSNMTVTKARSNGTKIILTAYGDAEVLKGCGLTIGGTLPPYKWITDILTSGDYGIQYSDESIILSTSYDIANPLITDYLTFSKDQNVWQVLQICAMYMGCKIFFADNRAYIVDMTVPFGYGFDDKIFDYGDVDLRSMEQTGSTMYGRVVGESNLGDEGTDTVINSQSGYCSGTVGNIGTNKEYSVSDSNSIEIYKTRAGNSLNLPNLVQYTPDNDDGNVYNQAETFVGNLLRYRCEPQQSISFTVREMCQADYYVSNSSILTDVMMWRPCFMMCSRVRSINDDVKGVFIDNVSDIDGVTEKGQLLNMSSYERSYPEGTTKYTFGVMANIDLSESTSQIRTALDSIPSQVSNG